jgi:hypothetical protein
VDRGVSPVFTGFHRSTSRDVLGRSADDREKKPLVPRLIVQNPAVRRRMGVAGPFTSTLA